MKMVTTPSRFPGYQPRQIRVHLLVFCFSWFLSDGGLAKDSAGRSYEVAADRALQSAILRCAAILRYGWTWNTPAVLPRLRGGLDFALHEPANISHGDGEIVLSLQVNPELRSVAEITTEA
jgi:hypothetical protein